MTATGVGSMPGEDFAEAVRTVVGELPGFAHLPELPARGAHASLTGRGAGLLTDIGADLQPSGWRLTDAPGRDQRRARSLLAQDLDVLEQQLEGYDGRLKLQVPGPLTLAASVELPRGERALSDHGARRDLGQALAAGVAAHAAEVRRRIGSAEIVVQVDEPALPAVLDGKVATASGFGRHRSVSAAEADRALRWVVEAAVEAGAAPVVHSCAGTLPVELLAGAGFTALMFDLQTVTTSEYDRYAGVLDGGLGLWPGVVPSVEPVGGPSSDRALVDRVRSFLGALGYDAEPVAEHIVVTPACGLSGASPAWARRALTLARTTSLALVDGPGPGGT